MPSTNFKDELLAEIRNLRAFAISLSGSVSLADDLVQELLLRAWSNSEKFQPGTSLRAWLFTILRNIYYSNYRKRSREVQDSDGLYARRPTVPGDQESHLDLEDFREAMTMLPAEQREVLTLIGASGLSYEEAAVVCQVGIGTIKSRLSRARAKLVELLELDDAPRPPAEPKVRRCRLAQTRVFRGGSNARAFLRADAGARLARPPLLATPAPQRGNVQRTREFIGQRLQRNARRGSMPRGDKSKYTDKQDRKAEHIEKSYESRGVPAKEAERRAWATVNKDDGGGKKRRRLRSRQVDGPSRRA